MTTQQQAQELKKKFEKIDHSIKGNEELYQIKQTARDYLKEVKGCEKELKFGKCGWVNGLGMILLCKSCQKLKDDLMEIING